MQRRKKSKGIIVYCIDTVLITGIVAIIVHTLYWHDLPGRVGAHPIVSQPHRTRAYRRYPYRAFSRHTHTYMLLLAPERSLSAAVMIECSEQLMTGQQEGATTTNNPQRFQQCAAVDTVHMTIVLHCNIIYANPFIFFRSV